MCTHAQVATALVDLGLCYEAQGNYQGTEALALARMHVCVHTCTRARICTYMCPCSHTDDVYMYARLYTEM